MSTSYSLVEDKVSETVTVAAIEESQIVRNLGERDVAVAKIEADMAKAQTIIDTYTTIKANLQTKLDTINAL